MCCLPFLKVALTERGEGYTRAEDRIKLTVREASDEQIEVIVGIDELCKVCPLCIGDRCESPQGDEEEVRKWDSIIMEEIGVSEGATLTASEWRKLIREKFPLAFCRRCKARDFCDAGDQIELAGE
jgi:hypothetical protein